MTEQDMTHPVTRPVADSGATRPAASDAKEAAQGLSLSAVTAGIAGAVLSNRGLAVIALVGCTVLIRGPWLRPAISRDFRAAHIPWPDLSSALFLPEFVAEVPRAWRWDSIAVPLLAVVFVGIVVVLLRPRWTSAVFGTVLALSIPAVAVSLWSHPGLVEFFEGEVRERAMLRAVFRHESEDLLSGQTPDRLLVARNHPGLADDPFVVHPVWLPLRYSMYGPWLIGFSLVAMLITGSGDWPRRIAYASAWIAVGVFLAGAVTSPRWISEYHFARAESKERARDYAAAERSLESASAVMPRMAHTRRYWLARGRLGYRQRRDDKYATFFLAQQFFSSGDAYRARALLEPLVQRSGGTPIERDLLAKVLGTHAVDCVTRGDYCAAELAWSKAANMTPWKPAYWIAQNATSLAANPDSAEEIEKAFLPRLLQVGDRIVESDCVSLVGDAYFASGDFHRARDMYARAMDVFNLPKLASLHAQAGRLGL